MERFKKGSVDLFRCQQSQVAQVKSGIRSVGMGDICNAEKFRDGVMKSGAKEV